MENFYVKIGEHYIKIVNHSTKHTEYLTKHFQPIKNSKKEPDLVIHLEVGYGVPFKNYEVNIIKRANSIFFRRADYLIEVDHEYTSAKIAVHDELALKHGLMNLYSSFIVHHNWGLLVHSSCVCENGKAHIFAGQSGAGKSTAAKLSHPRELLSDEATLIKITPDEVTVFDSPFRSELETTHHQNVEPLKSIQILYQAFQNKRTPVKKADGLIHLIDKVFYWTNSQEETKKILHLLTIVVGTVPVYKLHFQKNNSFWELIS